MLDFKLSLQNNFRTDISFVDRPCISQVSEMISERDAVDRPWPPRRSGNRVALSVAANAPTRAPGPVCSPLLPRIEVCCRRSGPEDRSSWQGGQYKKISHSGISPRDWRHANDASAEPPLQCVPNCPAPRPGGSGSRESCLFPWDRDSSRHFF